MSAIDTKKAICQWKKSWKHKRDKELRRSAHATCHDGVYTSGVVSELFCPMNKVRDTQLIVGHTFPSKDVMLLRIVEEAIFMAFA
jgi:hypothetical protein